LLVEVVGLLHFQKPRKTDHNEADISSYN